MRPRTAFSGSASAARTPSAMTGASRSVAAPGDAVSAITAGARGSAAGYTLARSACSALALAAKSDSDFRKKPSVLDSDSTADFKSLSFFLSATSSGAPTLVFSVTMRNALNILE
jgi:hypothetical protein